LGALTEADADRTAAAAESVPAASPAKGAKRSRRGDTLGATCHERVESQGCPHCAGREIVGWGRSHGLLRLRCKSCGRTFNALTKTPLAHLRKKERWLDHARAMIEGKSLAKTAELCGVHSDDGLPLAASVSPRARTLRRIVEADETFILESFKGRWSDLPHKARKRGGTARHPRLHQDNIPVLVARDRKGATFDAVLLQVDSASVGSALAGVVTAANHLIGDGGKAIAAFARKAGIPFHAVPSPGKPTAEAPHSTSTTSTPTTAELSRMATRPRSRGRPTRPPNLDQGRHRKRPIPTVNAIRAKMSGSFTTSKTEGFMKALVAENDDRISRLHHDRRSGRRIGGRCAHGDDGGPYTGRRLRPSDHGRGTGLPFLEHAGSDQRLNANRRRQRSALSRLR
jgi:hypothetical protein